jgi:hypothetical protein
MLNEHMLPKAREGFLKQGQDLPNNAKAVKQFCKMRLHHHIFATNLVALAKSPQ